MVRILEKWWIASLLHIKIPATIFISCFICTFRTYCQSWSIKSFATICWSPHLLQKWHRHSRRYLQPILSNEVIRNLKEFPQGIHLCGHIMDHTENLDIGFQISICRNYRRSQVWQSLKISNSDTWLSWLHLPHYFVKHSYDYIAAWTKWRIFCRRHF